MADVTVNLDGLAATCSPGSPSETGSASVPLTGVAATGTPGSPTITGDANVFPSGRAGTTHAGEPILPQDLDVHLLGVQAFADPGVLFNNLVPDYMCCEGPYRLLTIFGMRIPIPPPHPPVGCDNIEWDYVAEVTSLSLHTLAWSEDLGLIVAGGNASSTATSTDGINWTAHTSVTNGATQGIVWSQELGIFVGVGQVGRTRTSLDGITWTENTAVSPFRTHNSVAWSPELGLFAMTSSTANTVCVWTSPDGVNWTPITTGMSTKSCRQIIWVPPGLLSGTGMFVVCGTLGLLMTSPDGATWTVQTTPDSTTLWQGVAYSPELEILVACTSTRTGTNNRTMNSTDGVTWNFGTVPSDAPTDYGFNSICWSPTLLMFACVGSATGGGGNDGSLMHSSDGVTFIQDPDQAGNRYDFVASADQLRIFVGINQVDSGGGFIVAECIDA